VGPQQAAVRGHPRLTCLAVTTAQVYRSRAGERLARQGIRRLRRVQQPALGAVLDVAGCFAVLALQDRRGLRGLPVRERACAPVLPHRRAPPPTPLHRPCLPPLGVDGSADHGGARARDTTQRGSLPRPALLSCTGQGRSGYSSPWAPRAWTGTVWT